MPFQNHFDVFKYIFYIIYSNKGYHFLVHLSNSGDLLLWAGVRRRPSCVVRLHLLPKNYWANLNQIWYVASVGIVNFMTPTPRDGNFGVKSVKLMYFLKNLLLYSEAWFRQTNV